jgi:uncharacterized protein (DUF58 family)
MQKMEIPYGALDSIELLAKQIVEGFLIGLHKSPFHGFSVEFAEHRLYNDGESIKHIDWKVFGRTDKMFVKKYEEETNLRCQVILDISGSMYFPVEKEQLNKLQIACLTSACIQYLVKKQRDAFGLCTFATDIEKYFPAKASANQQSIMAHELEALYQSPHVLRSSNLSKVLDQMAEVVHQRSLIVIVSDFIEGADEEQREQLMRAVQHLRYKKHEVVFVDIFDSQLEDKLELENRPYQLIDMETGAKMKLHPSEVREQYQMALAKYKARFVEIARQNKMDIVAVDIRKPFTQSFLPYFWQRLRK